MHFKTRLTHPNIHDRMSPTVALNTDIIWLVLQHVAYTDRGWDYVTLRRCCHVSHEWYPLAKRMLFRFVVLKNRRQLLALQHAQGKHIQTEPNAPPMGLGYDVTDIWEAHTRILECHWCKDFRFNDIRQALALFPSLYEFRVSVDVYDHLNVNLDDSSLTIPSTIRAFRYTGLLLSAPLNIECASYIISVLSKHSQLHCLQIKGVPITPHLRSSRLFQSVQVNALLYLELEIWDFPVALSGDLFSSLLYLVLHQKLRPRGSTTFQHGVFKKVKSLTVVHYYRIASLPEAVSLLSRLSETFPELTELRLSVRLHYVKLSIIAPLLSLIPSGLISLSLFMEALTFIPTEPAEIQPRNSFTIPTSLRYFEYGFRYPRKHTLDDPPVISPFLEFCRSKGVQLLPSSMSNTAGIVSIPIVFYK